MIFSVNGLKGFRVLLVSVTTTDKKARSKTDNVMIQGINHDGHARQRFRMFNVFIVCRKIMYLSRLSLARTKSSLCNLYFMVILQVALVFSVTSPFIWTGFKWTHLICNFISDFNFRSRWLHGTWNKEQSPCHGRTCLTATVQFAINLTKHLEHRKGKHNWSKQIIEIINTVASSRWKWQL